MSTTLKCVYLSATVLCLTTCAAGADEHTKDSLETVKKNLAANKAVLLDVREKDEWDDGHLKDATSAPISELKTAAGAKRHIEKSPKGKIVYTHCAVGGRALAAAKVLRQHGIDVRPLKAGYDDLVEAGFPKAELPEGPLGETIKLGEELVERTATHPLTKAFAGNSLNCTSCHLKNGTDLKAASFVSVATAYPAWSAREKRVITLEDRVLNCFMRSCNGIRPPLGGKVSVAIATYITWLSDGQAVKQNGKAPLGPLAVRPLKVKADQADRSRGAKLYAEKCASCHGEDGAGREDGPPVWGKQSYNQGAGFAKNDHLAAWLKVAMPLDDADLTEQEAIDIAAFINSHVRPAFALRDHLPHVEKLGEFNAETSDGRSANGK